FERAPPNNLPALATALPASEVRKNLRRDQSSMGIPPKHAHAIYNTCPSAVERRVWSVGGMRAEAMRTAAGFPSRKRRGEACGGGGLSTGPVTTPATNYATTAT